MAVLTVVVVAAGVGVNQANERLPPYGETSVAMELGRDAVVPPFQILVHGARGAEHVQDITGEPLTSSGVWVLVELSYATLDRSGTPQEFELRDSSGRRFRSSERVAGANPWEAGADIWLRGEIVFEVPRDALGELTLVVWPQGRDQGLPNRYGQLLLWVDPLAVEEELAVLAQPVLLDAGER